MNQKYFIWINIASFFLLLWQILNNFKTVRYLLLFSIMNYYGNIQTESYSNTLSIVPVHIAMYLIALLFLIFMFFSWNLFFYLSKILYFFEYTRLVVIYLLFAIFFILFWYCCVWTYFYDIIVYLFWVSSSAYDLLFDVNGTSYLLWVYFFMIGLILFIYFLIFLCIFIFIDIRFIHIYCVLRLVYFLSIILFLIIFIPDAITHMIVLILTFFIFESIMAGCLLLTSLKKFLLNRVFDNYKDYVFLLSLSYKLN